MGQTSSSLFQCQASSEQSGQVSLPNIPDLYFNISTIPSSDVVTLITYEVSSSLATEPVYIYRVPSQHSCSGIVTAIQYCYQFPLNDINNTITVFNTLTIFNLEDANEVDNIRAIVRNRFGPIQSTPSSHKCVDSVSGRSTPSICCDTFIPDQFELPSASFAYGVEVNIASDIQLLAFSSSSDTSYQVNEFGVPFLMNEFTLTPGSQLVSGLVLLRFLIGTSHNSFIHVDFSSVRTFRNNYCA